MLNKKEIGRGSFRLGTVLSLRLEFLRVSKWKKFLSLDGEHLEKDEKNKGKSKKIMIPFIINGEYTKLTFLEYILLTI